MYKRQVIDPPMAGISKKCAMMAVHEKGRCVAELTAKNFSIGTRCYVAEVSMDVLFENRGAEKVYTPLPKFPAVTRDLAASVDGLFQGGEDEFV